MKTMPPFEELVRSNPKVDQELVALARANIDKMRRSGFVPEGYRLASRGRSLIEKQSAPVGKEQLPRRHR